MPRDELMTFDEIEKVARVFVKMGVRKIRLTGGEPLVRRGIEDLCFRLASVPRLQTLGVTTNGVYLLQKALALKKAGVQMVNSGLVFLQAMNLT